MCEVETGVQILQRISSRLTSNVKCLDSNLFPDGGPAKGEMVEIVGESNCGKSILVLELIAKIILPTDCGGHALGAVFVNCDNNINMIRLLNVMEKQIVNCSSPANRSVERQEIHNIREESLARLSIIKCCTLDEFEFSMLTLSDIFIKNPLNVYLLIDSIVAFYWNKCTEKNLIRMDTYVKSLHNRLKKLSQERKVIIIFTRPSYFGSGRESIQGEFAGPNEGPPVTQTSSATGGTSLMTTSTAGSSLSLPIEHRIELGEVTTQTPSDDRKFNAFVYSKGTQLIKFYIIDRYGINWLN
ncbi:DNA repair protein RAD51 homolog 2-like [Topomyia yanbarensis]|uniref:DNA repair protein RAD51 homolog 2-like n=1 Tax=Topomyia yanbarensis TaxID=2498891 RepID=UPI00273C087E|nr:DNA repair protein RAD51 homolog 2-like [Topomyia yanbarensis]